MTVSTDPRIGTELLGYRIEELLGRGGMGVVYRAYDVRLKRNVALKLVAPELSGDERFRERFLAETEIAASLEHPSVVPIHDAGEVEGQLYLVMRQVEGSDLKTLLAEERPVEPARALAICRQIADALDAAHERGLVHRDVKPSNVLLDSHEHVYLADFGLARRLAEPGIPRGPALSLGTPAYAAPEQIEGKPVDGRADIYSLGCLLHECLTGQVPYPRDSELAVLWAHVNEQPPKITAYPALDPVIAKALAKDPEKRQESCAQLVEATRNALGLRDVVVVRDRKPLLLAGIGALVAAGALVAGLVLAFGGAKAKADLTIRNNTLVRVDPAANEIAAVTQAGQANSEVGAGSVGVAVGGKSVWVYNWDEATVRSIDPETNQVRRTVSIGGVPPSAWVNTIAAEGSTAWVLSSAGGTGVLTRVDSGIGLPKTYPLHYDPIAVAVGERSVWVLGKRVSGEVVLRINPTTGAVLGKVPLSGLRAGFGVLVPNAQSIAVGAGAVWAAIGARLYRIDPATTRLTGRVNLPAKEVLQVAADDRQVWLLVYESDGNSIVHIDPVTLRVKKTVRAPDIQSAQNESEASRIAIGEGAVWWIGADSGVVWRVDPRAGKVVATIPFAPPVQNFGAIQPFGIATGAGGVWVTVTIAP